MTKMVAVYDVDGQLQVSTSISKGYSDRHSNEGLQHLKLCE